LSITCCDAPLDRDDLLTVLDPSGLGGLGEGREIEFAAGLPGFPGPRRFRLEDLGPNFRPFCRLRSLSDPEISFTVVTPGLLFPDYSVEIDDDHQAALAIEGLEDVATLVMITVPQPPQPPTANLLGPIVVNRRTGSAAQVVQHRSTHSVAVPLPKV
jgi:flagellar assembly factor FliW